MGKKITRLHCELVDAVACPNGVSVGVNEPGQNAVSRGVDCFLKSNTRVFSADLSIGPNAFNFAITANSQRIFSLILF